MFLEFKFYQHFQYFSHWAVILFEIGIYLWSLFSEMIISWFLVCLLISSIYFWDLRWDEGIIWPCSGFLFGIWCFVLWDASPMFNKLIISSIDKSSTNLNRFSSGTQSELWFVWESNSQFPRFEPMAPDPGIFQGSDIWLCHFTRISRDWKYDVIKGIKLGLTPLDTKDFTPKMWDWREYACFQSIKVARTAFILPRELPSVSARILCTILTK